MIRSIFISVCIFFTISAYSQSDNLESYQERIRSGDYYPYWELTDEDNLQYPINHEMTINIQDLRDIKNNSDYFYLKIDWETFQKYDTLYVAKSNEEINLYDIVPALVYPESDQVYTQWGYSYKGYINEDGVEYSEYDRIYQEIENHNDSNYVFTGYFEGLLPHKWDLRDYPFDKQNLKIVFRGTKDTSVVRMSESSLFPPKVNVNEFEYLLDGFDVTGVYTSSKYVDSGDNYGFADGYRNSVVEDFSFNIVLDRKGSYIYYKLFFGAFLSYIISLLVFFIDKKLFETRITLSLGGIFGAVGNKYFVENTMPSIQVLTKADIINNLIIIFIIINIFIVIAQSTKKINLGLFENNKYSIILSLSIFILLNLLIVIL
ncbi:MAG: hypothetical protein CMA27_04705 [Euryarchaeota archaeon]|nr:hypothetical protein [Euryarchaeota archaeon]|tara:strand:- start:1608 stop:2732 length:1125 start_codon:yes stop_codon:yes gene_type:complete